MLALRPMIALALAAPFAAPALAQDREKPDAAGGHPMDRYHTRHTHPRNPDHPTVDDPTRFTTNRRSAVDLPLPNEEDAFMFAVFGDRTGGPDEGVAVLKDAIRDANLLEPDLVMTVGDMIDGYNQTPQWLDEMREYKAAMDQLICPWFPVAGNHDIYWRGPNQPEGEHEKNYEMHFGPLWYAFEHKGCWFIALYSDEGNPETGEKSISRPDTQQMSGEQLAWLKETLSKASNADHVFVFLHHPRWRGGRYGDHWDEVHAALVEAGNVSAVFAGHIHSMKYQQDDGIEYFTLATVGGGNGFAVPQAGNLHHFNVVTVRKNQIATAAIPVGEVIDPRELTEDFTADARRLANARPMTDDFIVIREDGSAEQTVTVRVSNPTEREVEMMLGHASGDSRWMVNPDHIHGTLEPGEDRDIRMQVYRAPGRTDHTLKPLHITASYDLLTDAFRYKIPTVRAEAPLNVAAVRPPDDGIDRALRTGPGGAAIVDSESFDLSDGPLTIECRFRADRFGSRTGLIAKTQNSDYGIFVSDGQPHFAVHLDGRYRVAESADEGVLEPGRWYHIAGVFDGGEVRVYVDGELIDAEPASGFRMTNDLPFIIGADVGGRGNATSHFEGLIDNVRLSSKARYRGASFDPPTGAFESDSHTELLLDFDSAVGPYLFDASPSAARVKMEKSATLERIGAREATGAAAR